MIDVIEVINQEISRLNAAKALLEGSTVVAETPAKRPYKKRTMSPKARKAIAAAQRKRWAAQKAVQS
jgi:hypothetical protein